MDGIIAKRIRAASARIGEGTGDPKNERNLRQAQEARAEVAHLTNRGQGYI